MSILREVDESFKNIFQDTNESIVIAHSLGSVIAFDYLFGFRKYRFPPEWKVNTWLTHSVVYRRHETYGLEFAVT